MEIEYDIKPQRKLSLGLQELNRHRELLYFFTWRDIKIKYKQTLLGFAWAIVQPLLLMSVFVLFFRSGLQKNLDIPYTVFAFSGLMLWTIFSSGLSNAGNSMVNNANIIKKIYFPRLIIPISSILVAFFDFLMTIPVFIGLLAWEGVMPRVEALYAIPLGILLTLFGTFGPGCLLAALNVKFRDVRYLIPFFIQLLLFVSPVIYPAAWVQHSWLKHLLALNPMNGALQVFRSAFSATPIDVTDLCISIASSVFFLLLGILYFRKTEAYFADLA
ncbi:MAG: ABC transporter permease [Bacteroidia bacterium]